RSSRWPTMAWSPTCSKPYRNWKNWSEFIGSADQFLSRLIRSVSPHPARAWPGRVFFVGQGLLVGVFTRFGQQAVAAEHCLDSAQGLAGAILVLDQREAHVIITVVAEAQSRRYAHLGFSQ